MPWIATMLRQMSTNFRIIQLEYALNNLVLFRRVLRLAQDPQPDVVVFNYSRFTYVNHGTLLAVLHLL